MNMGLFGKKERNIDIVFCIDATSSMGPCIENVRRNATLFYRDFVDKMTNSYNSEVSSLRIQIITFRDLESDVDAIVKSEFFELPADTALFERYLNGITPRGGGDYKESGLEALYAAMTTEWETKRPNDRQVIVLFTDADAIGFGEKAARTGYGNMVNKDKLYNTWFGNLGNYNTLNEMGKRLVLFAPSGSLYDTVLNKSYNRSTFCAVTAQNGMADVSFNTILDIICASASAI